MGCSAMSDVNPQDLISVLCVDDNEFVASAVAAKLRMAGGFRWAGHLSTANDLADVASRESASIVLLDVDMPGKNPFDALGEVLARWAECRVIVFSGHVHTALLDRAIEAGAWGYISKNDGEDAMLEGIRQVAAGEFALSPEIQALCERG
jgi:two-component system response regulator DesR